MKVIGLAGGIGTGKSTVSRFLAELGAVVIDSDRVGHECLRPGGEVWRQVVAAFGRDILGPGDEIDRARLGQIVFSDARARARLNRIMHPAIREVVESRLDECRRQGVAVVVLEVPLLLGSDWTEMVDEVWVTVAAGDTVLRRLEERSGLSVEQAQARIDAQLPVQEQAGRADVVIDTGCSLEELKAKVAKLWARLEQA